MIARAQDKRFWLAGGAVLAVLILAVGWFGVISPQLSSAKSLREAADAARAQNSVLAAKTTKLKKQNDNVGTLKTTLRTALAALPPESGLPEFTRQLNSQAKRNTVTLSSITVGAATSTGAVAGTAPTAANPTAATPTAATPTTTSGAAPSASTAAVSTAVMTIPVTLLCKGSSKNQLAFLKAIQVGGPRRALVTATTLSAVGTSSIDRSATMTIQLSVFSAPMSAAARAQLAKLLSTK